MTSRRADEGAAEFPRATYRLQFSSRFGFRDAARIAPYLADLGVSHVYASPYFAARPGSTHGYDVVDHNRLNPELGGPADFAAMSAALRGCGLGLIADFVPNHMGVGGAANRFWLSALEWGEASPFAPWFDIDWASTTPGLAGKLLVPFLGEAYGAALAAGAFDLRFDAADGAFAIWAHETHKLPVRPQDYAEILSGGGPELRDCAPAFEAAAAAGPLDPRWGTLRADLAQADPQAVEAALGRYRGQSGSRALDALIARQHWRAAKFNLDADAINYRRFFTISDLAGLRVETPEVFDTIHELLFEQLAAGVIDGVRIDHIDGLRDPRAYVRRLREAAPRPLYLLVEKILAAHERLPQDWGADGTTGYEFGNLMVGLLTNPAATEALTACYHDFTGRREAPEDVVRAAKIEIMAGPMAAETEGLARRLHDLAQGDPATRDLGFHSLRAGLIAVIASLDIYRTYADGEGMGAADRARIAAAVSRGRGHAPRLDPAVFDFLGAALAFDLPNGGGALQEAVLRFQQISGPVTAKGLEDTALYRFNRLIALNEVGSEPGRYMVDVAAFHAANAERLQREPNAMLATSTHDTKRGEDARMRIAAISWGMSLWRDSVFAWRDLLARPGAAAIDPNDEYFFYQLLLGAWPSDWPPDAAATEEDWRALCERVQAAMLKSVREAARNTRWSFGDEGYERDLADFIDRAFDRRRSAAFLASFGAAAAAFGALGQANSLVQTALKLTVPGVPDIYQGAEFWEQSLVDPDNRRDVDFERRAAALADLSGAAPPLLASRGKLALTARLLSFRRARPALFRTGSYEPMEMRNPASCAFLRRLNGETMLVAAAFGWSADARGDWAGALRLPASLNSLDWRDMLDPAKAAAFDAGQAFDRRPIVVMLAETSDRSR